MEETEAVKDAAATKPDGNAKDAVEEPDAGMSGRGSRPTGAFTEVREGMARFRAGQIARLGIRDAGDRRIRDRQGAMFANPWADYADRHDRPVREAVTRFQPLLLLLASLAATAVLLMLLGVFVTAVDVVSVHAVTPGAE